eukprot:TRINITY_DN2904_c0_g2_i2.p1 TRINITY_DN2904_c0_g2~~TRINITY_DN2904_c0_g2_i2.p1  ORF type:complete len:229 (-),score=71.33 TRINITY_DN2904_c0_g2_i2:73-759(-)
MDIFSQSELTEVNNESSTTITTTTLTTTSTNEKDMDKNDQQQQQQQQQREEESQDIMSENISLKKVIHYLFYKESKSQVKKVLQRKSKMKRTRRKVEEEEVKEEGGSSSASSSIFVNDDDPLNFCKDENDTIFFTFLIYHLLDAEILLIHEEKDWINKSLYCLHDYDKGWSSMNATLLKSKKAIVDATEKLFFELVHKMVVSNSRILRDLIIQYASDNELDLDLVDDV